MTVMQYASISILDLMLAVTGSQCKEIKRGVTWAFSGWLKTDGLTEHFNQTLIKQMLHKFSTNVMIGISCFHICFFPIRKFPRPQLDIAI